MRATSYWLGPQGRWTPSTWADLQRAAADGLLDETSWVELKTLVAPGKPANLELARDLASLALRSGLLVIGVRERARGVAGVVVGVPLAGYRDRIDQVARDRVHPPLYVDVQEIENPAQAGHGCLLVAVPATGPHMADERYWGRGDTGKRTLTDTEVREHLARRRADTETVMVQVRDLEQEHPVRDESDPGPRLFARAVPVDARPGCLRELTEDSDGRRRVQEFAAQVQRRRPDPGQRTPLQSATSWLPHARGRALYDGHAGQVAAGEFGFQVVFEDDGAVSLFHAGVHDRRPRRSWSFPQDADGPVPVTIGTELVLATLNDLLGVAGLLADGIAAYQGEWVIAVRVTDLAGCYDFQEFHDFDVLTPVAFHGGSAYEETTTVSTAVLVAEPWVVTERLLGRLVRALGAAHRYLPYLGAP